MTSTEELRRWDETSDTGSVGGIYYTAYLSDRICIGSIRVPRKRLVAVYRHLIRAGKTWRMNTIQAIPSGSFQVIIIICLSLRVW